MCGDVTSTGCFVATDLVIENDIHCYCLAHWFTWKWWVISSELCIFLILQDWKCPARTYRKQSCDNRTILVCNRCPSRCFPNYTLYLPEQWTHRLIHFYILTRLPPALILSTNSARLEYSSWGYCYGNFFWNFQGCDFSIDHILALHRFSVGSRAPTMRSRGWKPLLIHFFLHLHLCFCTVHQWSRWPRY